MSGNLLLRSTIVAVLVPVISGRSYAQHSHTHSDTASASHSTHGSSDMNGMDMSGASDDWKMIAMSKHMAYTTLRPETGTPSCAEASFSSAVRAAAAAPRMFVAPIAARVEPEPTANALSTTFVSSCAAVT